MSGALDKQVVWTHLSPLRHEDKTEVVAGMYVNKRKLLSTPCLEVPVSR